MYTSGRTVKSTARKPAGLTVAKATRDARKAVDATMPGVGATVTSSIGYDPVRHQATIVTMITFPSNHDGAFALWTRLAALPNAVGSGTRDSARMIVTRTIETAKHV